MNWHKDGRVYWSGEWEVTKQQDKWELWHTERGEIGYCTTLRAAKEVAEYITSREETS